MGKKIFSLLIILLLVVGCSKVEYNDYSLGNLNYKIPSNFKIDDSLDNEHRMYYIKNSSSDITITLKYRMNDSSTIEELINNDEWAPNRDFIKKEFYNDQVWYVQREDGFRMYTKYRDFEYSIRIESKLDNDQILDDLIKKLLKSLIFKEKDI